MIKSQDRSGWFGASDTAMVMGNWDTVSFRRWWLAKLGLSRNHFTNLSMQTGTAYEHKILDTLGIKRRDRQIKLRKYRLRVNLDGEEKALITEVKTYGNTFKVTKGYWQQCQVEMFAAQKKCRIAAYKLEPEDYGNWFRAIELQRVSFYPIEYDRQWIHEQYLPRLRILARCLKKGEWPHADNISAG